MRGNIFAVFLGLMTGIVGLAVGTKPGIDEVEWQLRTKFLTYLPEGEDGVDSLGGAAAMACRSRPGACYEFLRQRIDIRFEDRALWTEVTMVGLGRQADCVAVFGILHCPGGFALMA